MFRNRYFWLLMFVALFPKTEAKVTLTSIWETTWYCSNKQKLLLVERLLPENVYMLPLHGIIGKSMHDCDRNGQWTLALPTPEAGGPYTITFRTEKS
ncbi:hypothetical protein NXW47_25605 [Bacteroides thetaiotaomicron]|uniref:hypothetical protein n=1 Tax=Bacteroides thetaiotaomicron TaxID=818 RepID=UPI00216624A3|nr:hypothetical protein [Bacteroides thetaiotaomicron]MCS2468188.1 hypothetical protein [Bacteroides thetaiotaomicron]